MNKIFIVAGLIAAFGAGYGLADLKWESDFSKFKLDAEKDYSALLEKKIKADKENQARITSIEQDYQSTLSNQKKRYEKTIADLRANFKPSGVYDGAPSGTGMPRNGKDSPELICYTRSELYNRIAKTLAIGNRCDKLAIDYATLLRMVNGNE